MQRFVLATAAALTLSTGAALAASPDPTVTPVAPAIQAQAEASAYSVYYDGYVFPNDGSPSSGQGMDRPVAAQRGHGVFSRVYLYPPADGDDSAG
jgi:opacity protein-like surface antigen